LTRVIAAAQFKPYLSITPFHYIDDKYITLENVGIGTAVINEVVIEKNGKRVFNMIDLFEFKKEVIWDEYRSFGTEVDYLAAGDSIDLVKLSLENLISQKI
jgi:hypothetical protein